MTRNHHREPEEYKSVNIPIEQVGFAIIGTLILLGITAAVLNRFGLLTFGKTASCEDCAAKIKNGVAATSGILESRVGRIETDILLIKKDNSDMWKKLDKISDDVSYIRGWVSRNGD